LHALEKASSEEGEAYRSSKKQSAQKGSRSAARSIDARSESEEKSEGRARHHKAMGSEEKPWRREEEGRRRGSLVSIRDQPRARRKERSFS
jgi:hypothetical protein